MSGTAVLTEEIHGSLKKIKWAWSIASSSSGAVTGVQTSKAYNGVIERFVTIPDASTAPSASYDITVSDQDSTDVLMGAGANRAAASTEQVGYASLGVVANDKLTLKVANAGSSCAGVAIMYLR